MDLAAYGAQTESGLIMEEVFTKSAEVFEEVNSMHADMVIRQAITYGNMDISMTAEGETVDIGQKVKSKFYRFNEIEEIIVPQEMINQAPEL